MKHHNNHGRSVIVNYISTNFKKQYIRKIINICLSLNLENIKTDVINANHPNSGTHGGHNRNNVRYYSYTLVNLKDYLRKCDSSYHWTYRRPRYITVTRKKPLLKGHIHIYKNQKYILI